MVLHNAGCTPGMPEGTGGGGSLQHQLEGIPGQKSQRYKAVMLRVMPKSVITIVVAPARQGKMPTKGSSMNVPMSCCSQSGLRGVAG